MNEHREIMQKEIAYQTCACCNRTFFDLIIHHIDGNRKNNSKKNLIALCQRCHKGIHQGMKRGWVYEENKIKERIFYLRAIWLKKKGRKSIKEIKKLLRFERWLMGASWTCYPKSICNLCKAKKNLIYYLPENIKEFIPKSKQKNYSIVYCKKCLTRLLKEVKPYL